MALDELRRWILDEGLKEDIKYLRGEFVLKQLDFIKPDLIGYDYKPDWSKLFLSGSILAESKDAEANEVALLIALSALILSDEKTIKTAAVTILTQLSNFRSIDLAIERRLISKDYDEIFGFNQKLLSLNRTVSKTIYSNSQKDLKANHFQNDFWNKLKEKHSISVSAPTTAGKSFLARHWLVNEMKASHLSGIKKLAVFVAPTRALVTEIERELKLLKEQFEFPNLLVTSIPLALLGNIERPTIVVFTQERLQQFLSFRQQPSKFDFCLVDEAHKIAEDDRGTILQTATEKVFEANPDCKFIFLSPMSENPSVLLEGFLETPDENTKESQIPLVLQHTILVQNVPKYPMSRNFKLVLENENLHLGTYSFEQNPTIKEKKTRKRSCIAKLVGNEIGATILYANEPSQAEIMAKQISEDVGSDDNETLQEELNDLLKLTKDIVHPKFKLVDVIVSGVAFHYGNMPSLLRMEIERMFKEGNLKHLVCTSTLVEGVNLSAQNIVLDKPEKGRGGKLTPQEFWNLAGRAGRWGADFSGNIFYISENDDDKPPKKSVYKITKASNNYLEKSEDLSDFLENRAHIREKIKKYNHQEFMAMEAKIAYLIYYAVSTGKKSILSLKRSEQLNADTRLNSLIGNIALKIKQDEKLKGLVLKYQSVSGQALMEFKNEVSERMKKDGAEKVCKDMLPVKPDEEDAQPQMEKVMNNLNNLMFPIFYPFNSTTPHSILAVSWMQGQSLNRIISKVYENVESGKIKFDEYYDINKVKGEKKRTPDLDKTIRTVMKNVESICRFLLPKYLAPYIDIIKICALEHGSDLKDIDTSKYVIEMEVGASSITLLSLIELDFSRDAAIIIERIFNELGYKDLTKEEVLDCLMKEVFKSKKTHKVIHKEIEKVLKENSRIQSV